MGDLTVYSMLADQAEQSPDSSALLIGGQDFSRALLFETVRSTAAGLRALGLDRGDRAVIITDNRFEAVACWLGVNAAGLIDVPINSEARGAHLRYLIQDASPRVLIGQPDHLRRLATVLPTPPERVVVIGPDDGEPPFGPGVAHLSFDDLLELGRDGVVEPPRNHEHATMIYTSGTTGPSKGVLLPQAYYVTWARRGIGVMGMQPGQTCYTPEPLFHSDARSYVIGSLLAGGRQAVGQRFSVRGFWDEVRQADASYFSYLGTMLSLLHAAPPRADDADHPALVGVGGAAPAAIHRDFEERFGVRLLEMYGMTESIMITMNTLDDSRVGSVGKPVPELEVRLVDEHDGSVPPGEIGELALRPREPHVIMSGYWGKPEATVEAWRNLWFHTGDRMRADEDGFLYYVGRLKDSIRRRGENVSAWEVEVAMCRHPDVLEAAAIGVPSDLGEEDVAALVVTRADRTVDPEELHGFLRADLPRFAVPRYIEVVEELPKTPTERVNKDLVRARGLTDAAWDAEAAARVRRTT
ncbi:AMP-binding protein [Streptomyces noursei]|uniref:AMP-binding protein n=1 Tax=Streptomyces noursei TaxID=1971 RepID=UPI0033179823